MSSGHHINELEHAVHNNPVYLQRLKITTQVTKLKRLELLQANVKVASLVSTIGELLNLEARKEFENPGMIFYIMIQAKLLHNLGNTNAGLHIPTRSDTLQKSL